MKTILEIENSIYFKEAGLFGIMKGDRYTATFKLYEVPGEGDNGPYLVHKDADSRPAPELYSIEEANVIVEGCVKWDGCCEWETIDTIHTCTKEQFVNTHIAIYTMFTNTNKLIFEARSPNFNTGYPEI